MSKPKEVQINQFQLNVLLDEKQKQAFTYMLNNGVYCVNCNDNCPKGVAKVELYLSPLNDIKIKGTCKVCGGAVTRIVEFGQEREFYEKANKFRKSVQI